MAGSDWNTQKTITGSQENTAHTVMGTPTLPWWKALSQSQGRLTRDQKGTWSREADEYFQDPHL